MKNPEALRANIKLNKEERSLVDDAVRESLRGQEGPYARHLYTIRKALVLDIHTEELSLTRKQLGNATAAMQLLEAKAGLSPRERLVWHKALAKLRAASNEIEERIRNA